MQFIARLLFVALLAAFAVSSVAHAAGSAKMAADMVAIDVASMDMADCEACDGPELGGMGLACDFLCSSGSFAAVLGPQGDRFVQPTGDPLNTLVTGGHRGLICPPTEHPPRTHLI